MGVLLGNIFDFRTIVMDIKGTKETVFTELTGAIAAVHPECNQTVMLTSLWEREKKLSTGIASGIAIPHAICNGITTMVGAVGISKTGIEYDALDQKPVHVVFMVAMGENEKENHLSILEQIFAIAQSEALALIKNAQDTRDVYTILSQFRIDSFRKRQLLNVEPEVRAV
jgi:mannitol/fructose-specific phosphotransferase system IIA component (Ntr-type)